MKGKYPKDEVFMAKILSTDYRQKQQIYMYKICVLYNKYF